MASLNLQKPSDEADDRPRLELVKDEVPASPPIPSSPTTSPAAPSPSMAALFGVLRAISMVLAVRFLLLLTLLGAGVLATMAMMTPIPETMAVLAIYCVLVVLPMVWLERGAAVKRG